MELTAKEILEKHLGDELTQPNVVITYVESRTILAAMKEAVENAYLNGWADRDEGMPFKSIGLKRTINSLFPESK